MSANKSNVKIAIVSGASSGVGVEFIKQIHLRYPEIEEFWMLARRHDRMAALAETLTKRTRIFAADLTQENDLVPLWDALESMNPDIRFLINSAGYGTTGRFDTVSEEKALGMIDLNNRVLVQLTKRCLPYMTEGAKILNIASVSAFLPQPQFAIYAASKSFVLSFSRALHAELRREKITVTAVCPNPMETEFFGLAGDKPARKSIKDIGLEPVNRMVRIALNKADKGRDFSTSCWQAKLILLFSRILPHRFILMVERYLGLYN